MMQQNFLSDHVQTVVDNAVFNALISIRICSPWAVACRFKQNMDTHDVNLQVQSSIMFIIIIIEAQLPRATTAKMAFLGLENRCHIFLTLGFFDCSIGMGKRPKMYSSSLKNSPKLLES